MNIEEEMEKIISDTTIWTQKVLPAKTILLHQGGEITHNYYLESGIIKIYRNEEGENAIPYLIKLLSKGYTIWWTWWFIEL